MWLAVLSLNPIPDEERRKKRKLQVHIHYEYRCKYPQGNISKLNLTAIKGISKLNLTAIIMTKWDLAGMQGWFTIINKTIHWTKEKKNPHYHLN